MRFSLKWLLALMAYVALAAAAATNEAWYYADLLTGITFLATMYAILCAILARGRSRAVALGFAIVSTSYILCVEFAPSHVPTSEIADSLYGHLPSFGPSYTDPTTGQRLTPVGNRQLFVARRAFSSIATMLAGLIGSALGALAARNAVAASPKSASDRLE